MTVDDYYGYVFDKNVPGLPEKAAKEGLTPWSTCASTGPSRWPTGIYRQDERLLTEAELDGAVAR
jgi:hypothetical protein